MLLEITGSAVHTEAGSVAGSRGPAVQRQREDGAGRGRGAAPSHGRLPPERGGGLEPGARAESGSERGVAAVPSPGAPRARQSPAEGRGRSRALQGSADAAGARSGVTEQPSAPSSQLIAAKDPPAYEWSPRCLLQTFLQRAIPGRGELVSPKDELDKNYFFLNHSPPLLLLISNNLEVIIILFFFFFFLIACSVFCPVLD